MSAYWGTEDHVTTAVSFDYAEAVSAVFEPGKPADVKRIILVGTEASNGAEVITVAVRDAGDAGNSVTVGTFTIPSGFAVDAVAYIDIAMADPDGAAGDVPSQVSTVTTGIDNLVYTSEPGVVSVPVGKEIAITSTGGTATTGTANAYFEFVEKGQDLTGFTELAFTLA